jgi:hypothetical protein
MFAFQGRFDVVMDIVLAAMMVEWSEPSKAYRGLGYHPGDSTVPAPAQDSTADLTNLMILKILQVAIQHRNMRPSPQDAAVPLLCSTSDNRDHMRVRAADFLAEPTLPEGEVIVIEEGSDAGSDDQPSEDGEVAPSVAALTSDVLQSVPSVAALSTQPGNTLASSYGDGAMDVPQPSLVGTAVIQPPPALPLTPHVPSPPPKMISQSGMADASGVSSVIGLTVEDRAAHIMQMQALATPYKPPPPAFAFAPYPGCLPAPKTPSKSPPLGFEIQPTQSVPPPPKDPPQGPPPGSSATLGSVPSVAAPGKVVTPPWGVPISMLDLFG